MKFGFVGALALSLAMSQVAVSAASAETPAAQPAHFRSAAAQTFSTADLERYGLSTADAQHVAALQQQGYHVQVMSRADAERVYGGQLSTHTWIIIGVVALVVIAIASID
jgi:hypothetical protein